MLFYCEKYFTETNKIKETRKAVKTPDGTFKKNSYLPDLIIVFSVKSIKKEK